MKSFLPLALVNLLVLFFSACNDELFDTPLPVMSNAIDTVEIVTPMTHMVITELEVLQIPRRKPNGEPWDTDNTVVSACPDFSARIISFSDEEFSLVTDTLNHNARDQDYEASTPSGSCTTSAEGATLNASAGNVMRLPINFQGSLKLIDIDYICSVFNGLCGAFATEMHQFVLLPREYINEMPTTIILQDEVGGCQYVLRLTVLWT